MSNSTIAIVATMTSAGLEAAPIIVAVITAADVYRRRWRGEVGTAVAVRHRLTAALLGWRPAVTRMALPQLADVAASGTYVYAGH